jgi:hypothetical protein
MKFPHLALIATIRFTMKGGAQVEQEFLTFSAEITSDGVTNMKWTLDTDRVFLMPLSEIAAIQEVKHRRAIRWW